MSANKLAAVSPSRWTHLDYRVRSYQSFSAENGAAPEELAIPMRQRLHTSGNRGVRGRE